MENLFFVIFMLTVSILALAIYVILKIINKKSILVREQDFISVFIDKEKTFLLKNKSFMDMNVYIALCIAIPVGMCLLIYFVTFNPVMSLLGLIGVIIPHCILSMSSTVKESKFDEKYSRSLNQMSTSIRAGMSIAQAIESVCSSPFTDEAIKELYSKMNAGLKMGKSVETVFTEFAEATQNTDAADVAAAISMQVKVGGNEARVIENITTQINHRIEERKKLQAMFIETKVMIWAFDIIPIVLGIAMMLTMGDMFSWYTDSFLNTLVLVGILGVTLVGSVVCRAMASKSINIK